MKKLTIIASAVLLSLGINSSAIAKDGTYVASEVGRNGSIKVQVVIKDSKIASVKVLDWSETHPVADQTKTELIP